MILTSESVTEGHPDKVADLISGIILDACLELDPDARVACETLVKGGDVVLAGEGTVPGDGERDWQAVVREAIRGGRLRRSGRAVQRGRRRDPVAAHAAVGRDPAGRRHGRHRGGGPGLDVRLCDGRDPRAEVYARRAEIQVAYAIGRAEPVSVAVETFGTGDDAAAVDFVTSFDFRPAAMIARLGLDRPIYRGTTNYGHFGRAGLPWEDCCPVEIPATDPNLMIPYR